MDKYYEDQAGSGVGGFAGVRYQRGSGFFGRLLRGGLLPILRKVLPYLGMKTMDTGLDIADDMLKGEKFKDSASKRIKATGKQMATDAVTKMRSMRGTGFIRRRRKNGRVPKTKNQKTRKARRIKGRRKKPKRVKRVADLCL